MAKADTKTRRTDAEGTLDEVRIRLTDHPCGCGNEWFQLRADLEYHYEPVTIEFVCCGCGEPQEIQPPEEDDDE